MSFVPASGTPITNVEIADRLSGLAQVLAAQRENPYKVRAYRKASETIRGLPHSVFEKVEAGEDLTSLAGIGPAISAAIRELVTRGELSELNRRRQALPEEMAAVVEHPRVNPERLRRTYRALGISSIEALKGSLESGELEEKLGAGMARHFRTALLGSGQALLYDADEWVPALQRFIVDECGAVRAEPTGDFRRRVEVVSELNFVVEADDPAHVLTRLQRFGGGLPVLSSEGPRTVFRHPSGLPLRVEFAQSARWGETLVLATGSPDHLDALPKARRGARTPSRSTEAAFYRSLGLTFIEPELREGRGEVEIAARDALPQLITQKDIRGELHCHTTGSDGAQTIEQMVEAARERGLRYLGVTDHSQSLRIAGGMSEADLKKQLRRIERLNARLRGFRILKSAEVDILEDGRLDYPNDLLRELDYTVCSIHSRFRLPREAQTNRILRAMDNPHFSILGHATGRLLLKRPGYEFDFERVLAHARAVGCCFEINSSPDRLDLSAEHAAQARQAGVGIVINTDAHSVDELDFLRCGIAQGRRAALTKEDVLNTLPVGRLLKKLRRA